MKKLDKEDLKDMKKGTYSKKEEAAETKKAGRPRKVVAAKRGRGRPKKV